MRTKIILTTTVAWLALTLAGCPLGRGSKKLGDPCNHNNECAGARCASGMCTTACKSDAECATPSVKLVCKGMPASDPQAYGVCDRP